LVIFDYPFIGEHKIYAGLASKKGMALTAVIAAAIVGSSFLIWYLPQSSSVGTLVTPPRTELEIINDVYSRHNITATNIDSKFEEWKKGNVTASDMMNQISHDRTEIQNMRKELADARPAQEWQESFDTYVKALDSFARYLGTMETTIQSGNKADSQELDGLRKEMQDYLNSSIAAMPFGK
jgi:hypothetical protein